MKIWVIGAVAVGFALILITSPYWLYREIVRPNDEELPDWMGDARARKVRLLVTFGVLAAVVGAGALLLSMSEP